MWLTDLDAFYGGAAGGGKSDALLMAALQYVDVPGYNAILIRDTYANLNKPEGLMDRAHEWLQNTDAQWVGDTKTYKFPSGATIGFGYLDGPLDHFNYQSAAYQFVGIDEAVAIRENQAIYMFSRLRRLEGSNIPIRFRCASNPPTAEQLSTGAWVKSRYVDKATRENRIFISAKLQDNPHLDTENYTIQLNQLDPVTKAQLLEGDWNIRVKGRMFERGWFQIIDQAPSESYSVRYWDLAATEKQKPGHNPAFTAGVKISSTTTGLFFIEHVIQFSEKPQATKQLILQTAKDDGRDISIIMEQEPGSSGKIVIDDYTRLLSGFTFRGDKVTGSKRMRAMPFASQAEAGNVYLIEGRWMSDFLDQLEMFPDGEFCDMTDAASGGYSALTGGSNVNMRWL